MARQARTTENLKERIADALLELCSEKPFPDISISEITDRADVGRATYYRHFSSKEDVIVFKFKTIFESLPVPDPHKIRPHFDPDFQPPKNRDVVEQYFAAYLRHLEKNRDVLERIYAAKLGYALFLYLYRDNVATLQNAAAIDRYLASLHSASAFAIVDQWITSNFHESPEELANLLVRQLFDRHHEHHRRQKQCLREESDGSDDHSGDDDAPAADEKPTAADEKPTAADEKPTAAIDK